jgi:hypothetical protein
MLRGNTIGDMRCSMLMAMAALLPLLMGSRQVLYTLRMLFIDILVDSFMTDRKLRMIKRDPSRYLFRRPPKSELFFDIGTNVSARGL